MNEFREGYARAILDINGLRTDAEDPLDYIEGYNFAMRYDAQVKCKPGNKPCGKTCIPMKETCRVSGGGGTAAKIAGGVAAAGALGAAGTYALNKGVRNKVNNAAKGVSSAVQGGARDLYNSTNSQQREMAVNQAKDFANKAKDGSKGLSSAIQGGARDVVSAGKKAAKDLSKKLVGEKKKRKPSFGSKTRKAE